MGERAAVDIEVRVREAIRAKGVDPVRDADAVRALVDEALVDWEEQALVGAVAPIEDRYQVARAVLDNVAGLGPLQQYLDDPEVEGNRAMQLGRRGVSLGGARL